MIEFSDEDLSVLSEILWDEVDRNHHEPGRSSAADQLVTDELYRRVKSEAKQRGLWWAR